MNSLMHVLPMAGHVAMPDHAHIAAVHVANHFRGKLTGRMGNRLAIDADHPLDQRSHKAQVVRHEHNGHPLAKLAELVKEPGFHQRIDVGRGLIEAAISSRAGSRGPGAMSTPLLPPAG